MKTAANCEQGPYGAHNRLMGGKAKIIIVQKAFTFINVFMSCMSSCFF